MTGGHDARPGVKSKHNLLNDLEKNIHPDNQDDSGDLFSYILQGIVSDKSTRDQVLTELLEHPTIFRYACTHLAAKGDKEQTTYQKVLTETLFSALQNHEAPLLRLFAVQFIPILIWLHISRQNSAYLPGVAACLVGLHKFEAEKVEKNERTWCEAGVPAKHVLFPEVKLNPKFTENSPFNQSSLRPGVRPKVQRIPVSDIKKNPPNLHVVKSASPSTTATVCTTALTLYLHYAERICPDSIRYFCLFAARLCGGPFSRDDEELLKPGEAALLSVQGEPSPHFLSEPFVLLLIKGLGFCRSNNKEPKLTRMALQRVSQKANSAILPLAILALDSL